MSEYGCWYTPTKTTGLAYQRATRAHACVLASGTFVGEYGPKSLMENIRLGSKALATIVTLSHRRGLRLAMEERVSRTACFADVVAASGYNLKAGMEMRDIAFSQIRTDRLSHVET